MIGFFLFLAAILWAIWVMIMCVVAVVLMIFDMIVQGLLALGERGEKEDY